MTLTEFLLARIAEDEADVREMAGLGADGLLDPDWPDVDGYAVSSRMERVARRVLAECETKRKIVERFILLGSRDMAGKPAEYGVYLGLRGVVLDLAAGYADHEDYNPFWRP